MWPTYKYKTISGFAGCLQNVTDGPPFVMQVYGNHWKSMLHYFKIDDKKILKHNCLNRIMKVVNLGFHLLANGGQEGNEVVHPPQTAWAFLYCHELLLPVISCYNLSNIFLNSIVVYCYLCCCVVMSTDLCSTGKVKWLPAWLQTW